MERNIRIYRIWAGMKQRCNNPNNPAARWYHDKGIRLLHDDEITTQLLQHQAKTVEQKLANKIASGNSRPPENGASGQSAAIIKADPSAWTKADRAEVRRRVARGERITL